MKDILLDSSGDIFLNDEADIVVTDSILQAVRSLWKRRADSDTGTLRIW